MEAYMAAILINFRVPNQTKNDFLNVCKLNCTTMTGELVRFMKNYILEESQRLIECSDRSSQIQNMRHQYDNAHGKWEESYV